MVNIHHAAALALALWSSSISDAIATSMGENQQQPQFGGVGNISKFWRLLHDVARRHRRTTTMTTTTTEAEATPASASEPHASPIEGGTTSTGSYDSPFGPGTSGGGGTVTIHESVETYNSSDYCAEKSNPFLCKCLQTDPITALTFTEGDCVTVVTDACENALIVEDDLMDDLVCPFFACLKEVVDGDGDVGDGMANCMCGIAPKACDIEQDSCFMVECCENASSGEEKIECFYQEPSHNDTGTIIVDNSTASSEPHASPGGEPHASPGGDGSSVQGPTESASGGILVLCPQTCQLCDCINNPDSVFACLTDVVSGGGDKGDGVADCLCGVAEAACDPDQDPEACSIDMCCKSADSDQEKIMCIGNGVDGAQESPATNPSAAPTLSDAPSETRSPTGAPSTNPSATPTLSDAPSETRNPTGAPSTNPSAAPTLSDAPSGTTNPSAVPTLSDAPTESPKEIPASTAVRNGISVLGVVSFFFVLSIVS